MRAQRLGEREAVHVRHLDVGNDEIEPRAGLERRERVRRRPDRDDLIAGGLDQRRQHVAEEGGIVDQQHRARQPRRRRVAAAEPVFEGLRQEMADVDDLGRRCP